MKSIRFVLSASSAVTLIAFAATWSEEPTPSSAATQSSASPDACCDVREAVAGQVADEESKSTLSLTDLADVGVLREKFNADHGHPRMIALLSPTCPGCIESAKLFRSEILEKYKDSDLKAYIVWLPMVPGDARDRWDPKLLHDTRATHFWNGSRSVGIWFAEKVAECEPLGPVAWDVVYLFDPDTKWDGDKLTAVACPTPVYRHPAELAEAGEKLLAKRNGVKKEQ